MTIVSLGDKKNNSSLIWKSLVFISFIYVSNFFLLLTFQQTFIILLPFFLYIFLKIRKEEVIDRDFMRGIYGLTVIHFIFFSYSLLFPDRYSFLYNTRILLGLTIAVISFKICSRDIKRSDNINYELIPCNLLFVLNIFNFIIFHLVKLFNFAPLFILQTGSIQIRKIYHFIVTAPGELDRFTSFFGEPSSFIFTMVLVSLVFFKNNQDRKGLINLVMSYVCFSGSFFLVLPILVIYMFYQKKNKTFKISSYFFISFVIFSLIFLIDINQLIINRLLFQEINNIGGLFKIMQRYYNLQTGEFSISRLRDLNLDVYSIYGRNIRGVEIINFNNEFFFLLAKYGIAFLPSIFIIINFHLKLIFKKCFTVETKFISIFLFLLIFVKDFWIANPLIWTILIPLIIEGYYSDKKIHPNLEII